MASLHVYVPKDSVLSASIVQFNLSIERLQGKGLDVAKESKLNSELENSRRGRFWVEEPSSEKPLRPGTHDTGHEH